jgi:hypothetical protein
MSSARIEFPTLYQKQRELLFHPARYVWIEGATKSGKTHGAISWILFQAFRLKPGQRALWVAPIVQQAKIAFDRAQRYLPDDIFTANRTDRYIEIKGAGRVYFRGADNPDSLYGDDNHAIVVDEASRCKPDVFRAVRSTLTATRGPIRIIGNVKGRSNWFYKGSRRAEQGISGHHFGSLTAGDAVAAGVVEAEEVEDARQTFEAMGKLAEFLEIYFNVPTDDGGNPFGLGNIARQTLAAEEVPGSVPVAWGWDLAKSTDWTAGIGLDAEGRVCEFHHFQKSWEETIEYIKRVTGRTPALVDSTGVGDPIVERLQRDVPDVFEGFKFSSSSKQSLMEGLAMAIGGGTVWIPEGAIINELEVFEYEYRRSSVRYSAPEGFHDDCVMALALAVRHWGTVYKFAPDPVPARRVPLRGKKQGLPFA